MPGAALGPGASGSAVQGTYVHYPPFNAGSVAKWDANGAIYSSSGWVDIWPGFDAPSAISGAFSGLISGNEVAEINNTDPTQRLFVVPADSGGTWVLQVRAQSETGTVLASTPWLNTGQRIEIGYDGTHAYVNSGTMAFKAERSDVTDLFFCFPDGTPRMSQLIVGTWPLTSSDGRKYRNPLNGPVGAALTTTNGGGDPWTLIVGSSVYSADRAFSGSTSAVGTSATSASNPMKMMNGAQRRVKDVAYVCVPEQLPTAVEPSVLVSYTLGTPTSAMAARVTFQNLNTANPRAVLTTRGQSTAPWTDHWTCPIAYGPWFRWELDIDAGDSPTTGRVRARMFLEDGLTPTQDSGWIEGVNVAGIQGCIGDVRAGTVQGVWIDHLGVAEGALATDDPWPSNYPPTVALLPTDQMVPAGEAWAIEAHAEDDQGIASYEWLVERTVEGVTVPVTTGLTGQGTATLTGDGTTTVPKGAVLTVTCRVTDLGGLTASATTRVLVEAGPILPIRDRTTQDILYGSRSTTFRYELLSHDQTTGLDTLIGYLDGVEGGSLQWAYNAAVKGAGSITVLDLATAAPGLTRIGDVNLVTVRIRPVAIVQGLPENPLGVFVITAAPETWESEGRSYTLELHDKCSVMDQDATVEHAVALSTERVLEVVQELARSCGETVVFERDETATLPNSKVWDPGTSKLEMINELLDAIGYDSLWMDGQGNLRATKSVLPADRPTRYDILGIERELVDGPMSVYSPSWARDIDSYGVPNRVVAVGQGSPEEGPPPAGVWTNEDPNSPYSYQARGRWLTHVITGQPVADGTEAEQTASLQARARATLVQMSSPVASVEVKHLPLPLRVGDVLRFANTPAGIDSRHYVSTLQLDLSAVGLMTSSLREVQAL